MRFELIGRYRLGLVLITGLYIFYYLFFVYYLFHEMPLQAMHVSKFLFVIVVFGVGWFGFRGGTDPWLLQSWRAVYAFFSFLFFFLWAYDTLHGRLPLQVREVTDSLLEFLISPILYVVLGILKRFGKSGSN